MRLMIDLSEEFVNSILPNTKNNTLASATVLKAVKQAVKKGRIIPKGCGRLGDLDKLEQDMLNGIKASNLEEGYENYGNINNVDDCVECVRYADTIIEADKK